jgi:hypothetical protein
MLKSKLNLLKCNWIDRTKSDLIWDGKKILVLPDSFFTNQIRSDWILLTHPIGYNLFCRWEKSWKKKIESDSMFYFPIWTVKSVQIPKIISIPSCTPNRPKKSSLVVLYTQNWCNVTKVVKKRIRERNWSEDITAI